MEDVLPILRSVGQVRSKLRSWRIFGETVTLVPVSPGMNDEHRAALEAARGESDRVIAAFVPFGRDDAAIEDADIDLLDEAGVDAIYLPDPEAYFPQEFATSVSVGEGDGIGAGEQTVTGLVKMLNQVRADVTLLLEPDNCRYRAVERAAADLDIPTRLMRGDGTGMSGLIV